MKKSIKCLASIGMITAMTILLSLLFSSKVFAWMPSLVSSNPTTGIFPQGSMQITMSDDRLNYLIQQWTVEGTGAQYFCADQGRPIRSGHFDSTIYYAEPTGGVQSPMARLKIMIL